MLFKIITVSAIESQEENELNSFLSSHKVISIEKHLMTENNQNFWTFCIQYMEGDPPNKNNLKYPVKIDYREVLNAEEFIRFSDFRKIRKQLALDEALPAFAIFNDAELAEMAKAEALSLASMLGIKGIGDKKVEKYGIKFIKP
jgi:superfamily II DNA helicase RecQ